MARCLQPRSRTLLSLVTLLLLAIPATAQPEPHHHPTSAPAANPSEKPKAPEPQEPDEKPDPPDPDLTTKAPPYHPIQAAPIGDRLNLTKSWLIHTGEDPSYASPTFDDSKWDSVDTTHGLWTDGIFLPNQLWYRTHIQLPPNSHNLAVTVANFGGSYRLFANGQEIGGHGLMANRGDDLIARSDTFPIPDALIANQPNLILVLHGYVGTIDRLTFTRDTGLTARSSVFLGDAKQLDREQKSVLFADFNNSGALLLLWTLAFILAIALAILIPTVNVYRFLAIYAGSHLIVRLLTDYDESHYLPATHWTGALLNLALVISVVAALELCRLIAERPRRRWLTLLEALYFFAIFSIYLAHWGVFSFFVTGVLSIAGLVALVPAFLYFVVSGARRKMLDAQILLGTGLLYGICLGLWFWLKSATFQLQIFNEAAHTFLRNLTPPVMADASFILGFLIVLIVHTLRIIRERASIASEIEAARTMQQLLLARSSDPTPGFLVESAYIPAGEVGGDFFLVTVTKEGDLSVIVGDVSGKGLRAAMRVSMILGVLRREPSRDPATVLCSLNEALLSQSEAGFTTAVCARLTPSGRFTIANAGHISPYLVSSNTSTELLSHRTPARTRPRSRVRSPPRPAPPRPASRPHVRRNPRSPQPQRRALRLRPAPPPHPPQRKRHRHRRSPSSGRRHHRSHPLRHSPHHQPAPATICTHPPTTPAATFCTTSPTTSTLTGAHDHVWDEVPKVIVGSRNIRLIPTKTLQPKTLANPYPCNTNEHPHS